MTFTLVFECPQGYVTDSGAPIELRSRDGAVEVVTTIPRYGVWKFDRSKRKHQVCLVTNDLAAAIARAEEPR